MFAAVVVYIVSHAGSDEVEEEEIIAVEEIDPTASVEVVDLSEKDKDWHDDLYKDKDLENHFKSIKSKRTEQNAKALKENGTFGSQKKT